MTPKHTEQIKDFEKLRDKIIRIEGLRDKTKSDIINAEKQITALNIAIQECEGAANLLELVGQAGRAQIKEEIESLVTHALSSAFDTNEYEFVVDFVSRRGKIECDLLLNTNGRVGNPLDESGGGTIDIITTTLRFATAVIINQDGPILLDEPGKNVSAGYQIRFAYFLKEFAEKTGRQIIMPTHIERYVYASPSFHKLEVEKYSDKSSIKNIVEAKKNDEEDATGQNKDN